MHVNTLSLLPLLLPAVLAAVPARSLVQRATSCRVKGYDSKTDAYFYNDSGNLATYDKCASHCLADSKCVSFGVGEKTCLHFTVDVASNIDRDSTSAYTYSDRACISATSSSSTSSSSSSRTSTSSSTSSTRTSSSTSSSSSSTRTSSSTSSTKASSSSISVSTSSTRASSSSTTASSSATSSSTGVAVPAGCHIPPSYHVSYFHWYNGTHNLDCAGSGPDVGDGTTCFNSTDSGTVTCDPRAGPCQTCGVPACYTGLPLQPLGYGPPDRVDITVDNFAQCVQTNPQSVHRYEVGEGYVYCGSSADFLNFYGSSNTASSIGRVELNPPFGSCDNGQSISAQYTASFPITCTRDAQRNATCDAAPFDIPLASYSLFNNS